MHIITNTDALRSACNHLAKAEFVTVDTEFLRESTFWPELCLIQCATPQNNGGEAYVIDPLSDGIDLTPFFELMANESIVKVFHAARQDIEIIYKLGKLIPHPVFDTQVAAMTTDQVAALTTLQAPVISATQMAGMGTDQVVAISNEGRMLVFPIAELPKLSKGKGNKIISIPSARLLAREEFMVDVVALMPGQSVRVWAGKRHLAMKLSDMEHYLGERGRRGHKLPRGFQRVDRMEVVP